MSADESRMETIARCVDQLGVATPLNLSSATDCEGETDAAENHSAFVSNPLASTTAAFELEAADQTGAENEPIWLQGKISSFFNHRASLVLYVTLFCFGGT